MKAQRVEEENDQYQYSKTPKPGKSRLDLNDLLQRMEEEKKDDKKINILILSGTAAVAFVVLLILNL